MPLGEHPVGGVCLTQLVQRRTQSCMDEQYDRRFYARLTKGAADAVIPAHLFAPFHEREFARVLKPGGAIYSVIPGCRHLWALVTQSYG